MTASLPASVHLGDQPLLHTPFGFAEDIDVVSNAATIRLDLAGRIYRFTTTTTAAFTLNVNHLAPGPYWASADLYIRTVAVPSAFNFAGTAVGIQVTGRTLAANPFVAGRITRVQLTKQVEGRYLIEFNPAMAAS